jgi:hypothetical protein
MSGCALLACGHSLGLLRANRVRTFIAKKLDDARIANNSVCVISTWVGIANARLPKVVRRRKAVRGSRSPPQKTLLQGSRADS